MNNSFRHLSPVIAGSGSHLGWSAATCAHRSFVSNSDAMMWRKRIFFLCALFSVFALSASSQDAADFETVRPSGVAGPVRKAKAVTAKESADADADTESSAPKTKKSKSTHARSH